MVIMLHVPGSGEDSNLCSQPMIYACMKENLFVWDWGREICVCVREREWKREGEGEKCSGDN